ncbi:MAG: hypothetical protein WA116_06625 [Anaerolineaceae bacterium]
MNKMQRFFNKIKEIGLSILVLPFSATTNSEITQQNHDFLFLSPNQKVLPDSLPFHLPIFQRIPVEGLSPEKASQERRGETNFFLSLGELKSVIKLPLYTFNLSPLNSKFDGAFVTNFEKERKIWVVRQVYSDDKNEEITIDTIPIESRPVPVSPVLVPRNLTEENAYIDDADYLWVYPEYTKDTPTSGIIQNYGIGYSLVIP